MQTWPTPTDSKRARERNGYVPAARRSLRWARLAFQTVLGVSLLAGTGRAASFDVRTHGATGDGKTLDTAAVNAAIQAAANAGGGTVSFPAGTYACYSIHLRSNVTLHLEAGSTILAAEPADGKGYDPAEPNQWEFYQDFAHSHWHNSLLWGENLENVSIGGPGRIFGRGLSKGKGLGIRDALPGELPDGPGGGAIPLFKPRDAASVVRGPFGYPTPGSHPPGIGNKAISLVNCRNVTLRDFTIYHGGHFGVLATGVDLLTIDNLKIDTNRDGIDIDVCRNVRVSNCTINSPEDDALCLKSSFALGPGRGTENVTITNCIVSGFTEGTLLDATFDRSKPKKGGPNGRIKLGTESSGTFRNITISNCVFVFCRGLALEMVDGGALEDVAISNLTMRDIFDAPVFVRLGARGRGPEGRDANNKPLRPVGVLRRVRISDISAYVPDLDRQGILIDGVPGHAIEDLALSNIFIESKGGGTKESAARVVEELDQVYPEPAQWKILPAWGLWARHVRGLTMTNLEFRARSPDARPPLMLIDARDVSLDGIRTKPTGAATLVLKQVGDLSVRRRNGVPDLGARPEIIDATH